MDKKSENEQVKHKCKRIPRSSLRLANQGEGYERRDCGKLLPNCIFCNKTKLVRKTDTKEKLLSCVELRVDDSIRKASLIRGDQRIAAITRDDLIAKEAKYHKTCCRDYTQVNYKVERTTNQMKMSHLMR